MDDQRNVVSQKDSDMLSNHAERTQQTDDSKPKSSVNVVSAGEMAEDVDAAAATDEHEEDADNDDDSLSENNDTQLHSNEGEKTGVISGRSAIGNKYKTRWKVL